MPAVSLLIKPASGLCQLRCRYCFYADEMRCRETPSFGLMTAETLETVIRKTFAYADGPVSIAFQGGEPTLAGLDFFRHAAALASRCNVRALPLSFAIQTNGLLLDEAWAGFLAEQHFLVGISLDGPRELHDGYRIGPDGRGTFDAVMERIALLRSAGAEFNTLTVVTRRTAEHAREVYRFFREHGLDHQQYIACIDPLGTTRGGEDYSLTPGRYAKFLRELFDCWYDDLAHGEPVHNRYFENLVGMLLLEPPESCGMLGRCTEQHVVEADGSVYPCDFYALDRWRLGNLRTDSFEDLARRRLELGFIESSCAVCADCRACRWYPICRGGCRRDREAPDGTLGRNYLCSAYRSFFEYAMPRLERLAAAAERRR